MMRASSLLSVEAENDMESRSICLVLGDEDYGGEIWNHPFILLYSSGDENFFVSVSSFYPYC